MLDKFFNNDQNDDNDTRMQNRDRLVRDRMQSHGVSEEEATRMILSEEQLDIGKRDVRAGEVEIHKEVDTRHVRENVGLRHDEVEVERRPITGGYGATEPTIGEEGEIRIPLHAEEVVVEKRVVPQEELVVRKQTVVENETVDADLRRERAEVHREDAPGSDLRRDERDRFTR